MDEIIEEINGRVSKALQLLGALRSDVNNLVLNEEVLTAMNDHLAQVVRFSELAEGDVWSASSQEF
jgi:hypothetical protein